MNFQIRTDLQHSFEFVSGNFSEDLFNALAPPFLPSKLLEFDGDTVGGLVRIELGVPPFASKWVSKIVSRSEHDDQLEFVDVGVELPKPLREWHHRHVIKRLASGKCLVVDDITFTTGSKLLDKLMYPIFYGMFSLRKPAYKKYYDDLSQQVID